VNKEKLKDIVLQKERTSAQYVAVKNVGLR